MFESSRPKRDGFYAPEQVKARGGAERLSRRLVKTTQPNLSGEQLARCLAYLQTIVPSLEELDAAGSRESRARYAEELAQFVETCGVTPKLQEVRSLLLQLASEEQLKTLAEPTVWHKDEAVGAGRPRKRRARTH